MSATGLERYQIMQALGSGAQARTFRAVDRQTSREVAVKAFRLKGSDNWRSFDRFERECAILSKLSHPGIPAFLDHFAHEESGDYFLVMELVEGQTLLDYMKAGAKLPSDLALHILRQGMSILGYLHALEPRVLHRDVNPSNLMLDAQGALKLIDFGAAAGPTTPQEDSSGLSTMMGTPGYMAPEQGMGHPQPRSDIYALGVSVLAALTGQTGEELPRDGLEVDLARCMPPGPLFEILTRCIAVDPEQRFESAAAAYDALASLVPPSPPPGAPPTADAPLPNDLEAMAQVKNPVIRSVFWIIAQGAVLSLTLAEEVMGLVDAPEQANLPAKPSKVTALRASMEAFSRRVQPFGSRPEQP